MSKNPGGREDTTILRSPGALAALVGLRNNYFFAPTRWPLARGRAPPTSAMANEW